MLTPMTVISRMVSAMETEPTLMLHQVLRKLKIPIRASGRTTSSTESVNKNTLKTLPLDRLMNTTATGRMARDMVKEL